MVNNQEEVEYSGFVTPSFILENSDTDKRGKIIDPYAKTEKQDGLLCGNWSRGLEDGLIHIRLMEPIAVLINERKEWVDKKMLLKEPIKRDYPYPDQNAITIQKKKDMTLPILIVQQNQQERCLLNLIGILIIYQQLLLGQ